MLQTTFIWFFVINPLNREEGAAKDQNQVIEASIQ